MKNHVALLVACGLTISCAADLGDDSFDPADSAPEESEGQSLDAEQLSSSAQALTYADQVYVIQAGNANCPNGQAAMNTFYIDNENTNNNNSRSGWIGATVSNRDTRFSLCAVSGSTFRPRRSNNSNDNYAVIKGTASCPAGSVPFRRYFDGNDYSDSTCTSSDPAGNQPCEGNLALNFCLFRASPTAPAFNFPNIGVPYGVFGAAGLTGTLEAGWIYSDDEDSNNNNSLTGDYGGSENFLQPRFSNGATRLFMARVR